MFSFQNIEFLLNGMMWGAGLSVVVTGIYVSMVMRNKKTEQ